MSADVKAKLNLKYMESGGTKNKYAPLRSTATKPNPSKPPAIEIINKAAVKAYFQRRIEVFASKPINLTELYFRGITNEEMVKNEQKTTSPPIVIISSGRADWIQSAINNGLKAINAYPNFTNTVTDPKIFQFGPVPFYYPKRYKANERNFYMFVHQSEYEFYKTRLDGSGITIIGWDTRQSTNYSDSMDLDLCLGFGMSRYVVFQFFKELNNKYRDSKLACKKIWMVDDNVCHIDEFSGFSEIESAKNDQYYGIGFFIENSLLADTNFSKNIYNGKPYNAANTIKAELALQPMDPLMFLQQAVLWNFEKIPQNLSFSPYFIGSNEDITFCRVLSKYNNPPEDIFFTYKKAKVLKSKAPFDSNSQGLINHDRLKKAILSDLNLPAHRVPLVIAGENGENPQDLFDCIQNGVEGFQQIEPKNTTYVKSGEQLSRTSMFIKDVNIFDAVPQACFITPDINNFNINRYK